MTAFCHADGWAMRTAGPCGRLDPAISRGNRQKKKTSEKEKNQKEKHQKKKRRREAASFIQEDFAIPYI